MAQFRVKVNGTVHTIEADPEMPLLYALRDDLGLSNPHFGCGLNQCGACTVHLNGVATRSCVTPMSRVGNAEVTTLQGLGSLRFLVRVKGWLNTGQNLTIDGGPVQDRCNGSVRQSKEMGPRTRGPVMEVCRSWISRPP